MLRGVSASSLVDDGRINLVRRPPELAQLVRACRDARAVEQGRKLHAHIAALGLEQELGNHLLQFYLHCSSLAELEALFARIERRDDTSWACLIAGHASSGRFDQAIRGFRTMLLDGVRGDAAAYYSVLKACAGAGALADARLVHGCMVESGHDCGLSLLNLAITAFGKCRSAADAMRVFGSMGRRDPVSWNSVIAANAQNGQLETAVQLFREMQLEGWRPEKITFMSALGGGSGCYCSDLQTVAIIHSAIVESGLGSDAMTCTALINAYAKLGAVDQARELFDQLERSGASDTVAWNSMIAAYATNRRYNDCARLLQLMHQAGLAMTKVTFLNAVNGCPTAASALTIHACVREAGLEGDLLLGNAMLDMYLKCRLHEVALELFETGGFTKNSFSWNAVMGVHGRRRDWQAAAAAFRRMEREGIEAGAVSFLALLDACALSGGQALELAKEIHERLAVSGLLAGDPQLGTAVLRAYRGCRSIVDARKAFEAVDDEHRDLVSWNAIISSYTQDGRGSVAIELFRRMDLEGVKPDKATFIAVLDACAGIASLGLCKVVHGLLDLELETDIVIATALVSMYGRCGSVERALAAFETSAPAERDAVLWNAMVAAFAQQGRGREALKLFREMQQLGTYPDEQSFIGILSACSHGALAEEGWDIFASMSAYGGVEATQDHYSCAVDLLGRAGWLDAAEDLARTTHVEANSVVWKTLLGACLKHGDLERGERARTMAHRLDPLDHYSYILMSNIYKGAGEWEESDRVRGEMEASGVKKEAGKSWVEVKGKVHEFLAGDRCRHPRAKEIYAEVEAMDREIRAIGYVPQTSCVLRRDVPEAEKERMLRCHSERLAIALGVMSSRPGETVRVMKNLRVCPDCHEATKLMSVVAAREIVVRDTTRFHRFRQGSCSCDDHW